MGSRPPKSYHDLFFLFFFWCKFGFGKCFGASSWTSHWASHSVLPYKIHLLSHITIRLRNDSLLYRIRVDDTSTWQIFQFVVISQGTHLLSFFTFSICFTYQTSIEWSTLSPWATSQVLVRGSTSMILSVGHCQLLMAGHYASHFQSSHFLCKTSWITLHSMFINSLQAKCKVGVTSCLHALWPSLNSSEKITRMCFLSNIIFIA